MLLSSITFRGSPDGDLNTDYESLFPDQGLIFGCRFSSCYSVYQIFKNHDLESDQQMVKIARETEILSNVPFGFQEMRLKTFGTGQIAYLGW